MGWKLVVNHNFTSAATTHEAAHLHLRKQHRTEEYTDATFSLAVTTHISNIFMFGVVDIQVGHEVNTGKTLTSKVTV